MITGDWLVVNEFMIGRIAACYGNLSGASTMANAGLSVVRRRKDEKSGHPRFQVVSQLAHHVPLRNTRGVYKGHQSATISQQ
jgi:hypothetical protein